jgi:DnaJ-domain-containing protein 1
VPRPCSRLQRRLELLRRHERARDRGGAAPGYGLAAPDLALGLAHRKRPLSDEEKALIVFELEPPFTLIELKRRYKILVKLHHPDANGGDKMAEERLKVITQAYALLKSRFFSTRDA